jgi:hypothetical protein
MVSKKIAATVGNIIITQWGSMVGVWISVIFLDPQKSRNTPCGINFAPRWRMVCAVPCLPALQKPIPYHPSQGLLPCKIVDFFLKQRDWASERMPYPDPQQKDLAQGNAEINVSGEGRARFLIRPGIVGGSACGG